MAFTTHCYLQQPSFSASSFPWKLATAHSHGSVLCGTRTSWPSYMWSHSADCMQPLKLKCTGMGRSKLTTDICYAAKYKHKFFVWLLGPVCPTKDRVLIKWWSWVISISSCFQLNSSWICLTSGLWNVMRYRVQTSLNTTKKIYSFTPSATSPVKFSCCFSLCPCFSIA